MLVLRFGKYPFFKEICFKLPHFFAKTRIFYGLKRPLSYKNEEVSHRNVTQSGHFCRQSPLQSSAILMNVNFIYEADHAFCSRYKITDEINIGGIQQHVRWWMSDACYMVMLELGLNFQYLYHICRGQFPPPPTHTHPFLLLSMRSLQICPHFLHF